MKIIDYLPVEIVFSLLRQYRGRAISNHPQAVRPALQKRGLLSQSNEVEAALRPIPRVTFWTRLCQAGLLLSESPDPYPTLLADEWVTWPFLDQIAHLLEAWLHAPQTEKIKRLRRVLLQHLQQNALLNVCQRQELMGLQALGICEGEQISTLGYAVLSGTGCDQYAGFRPQPWHVLEGLLSVPFPPDWKLLWELEKFFSPIPTDEVGRCYLYSLDAPALRVAVQHGALDSHPALPEILRNGLGAPPPADLLLALAETPMIRLIPGFVLEFIRPEDIKRLRQSPGMRRKLDHLLSPRHVALDYWHGYQVLQRLHRQGLVSDSDFSMARLDSYPATRSLNGLNQSERVYLLSVLMLTDGLQKAIAPPPGLLAKLAKGLDNSLRAAAARKATTALKEIAPQTDWRVEELPPAKPDEGLIESLQKAIDREDSVDVRYQASGRHWPEYRHLSPLLIESRGDRFYLIAYCHTRRANRTFRLDRLQLCSE